MMVGGTFWRALGAGTDPLPTPHPQKEEDVAQLGDLALYPANGTIDLMYFPYYGKKVHVSTREGPRCLGSWGGGGVKAVAWTAGFSTFNPAPIPTPR